MNHSLTQDLLLGAPAGMGGIVGWLMLDMGDESTVQSAVDGRKVPGRIWFGAFGPIDVDWDGMLSKQHEETGIHAKEGAGQFF